MRAKSQAQRHPGRRQTRSAARAENAESTRPSPLVELQRALGNATVQRLIQRYAVPAALECDAVPDWLDANSPFAPEWAETRSTFTFHGQARVSFTTLPDGSVEAHVVGHNGLRVSVTSPVDRPNWSPSRRPNRAAVVSAWQAMRATLDAHENQHRQIAERERVRVQGEFRGLDFTVNGADRAAARAAVAAEMQSRQAQWAADSQAAQDAIDPFRGAVLACPAPTNL
jgi:predicted secreted Zn-dependent protease